MGSWAGSKISPPTLTGILFSGLTSAFFWSISLTVEGLIGRWEIVQKTYTHWGKLNRNRLKLIFRSWIKTISYWLGVLRCVRLPASPPNLTGCSPPRSIIASHNPRPLEWGALFKMAPSGEYLRPLKNALFCSISVAGSNFYPRYFPCLPVVKISAPLTLNKIERFSKVSIWGAFLFYCLL